MEAVSLARKFMMKMNAIKIIVDLMSVDEAMCLWLEKHKSTPDKIHF